MDLKKKMKAFFTLNRSRDGGFTLVELIVVIAILAILGGVAVPAYSGYVERANKQADITLISEVADALTLYYYSNPTEVTDGYVILNQEGNSYTATSYNAAGDAAMTAVFGENWKNTVFLKYDDYAAVNPTGYKESSYYGKESELIGVVDKLTAALGDVVTKDEATGMALMGGENGKFNQLLTEMGVDKTDGKAIGNAAVLYVAQQTQGIEAEEILNAFEAGLNATVDMKDPTASIVNNLYNSLSSTGIGDAATMAAIYAYAEGFAQTTGKEDEFHSGTDFSNVTDLNSALTALGNSFSCLAQTPEDFANFNAYKAGQGNKDVQGYIDMMGTVNENASIVSGNLNSADCFTDGTVERVLLGHAAMAELGVVTSAGQVAVVLKPTPDGTLTHIAPPNYNK